MWIPGVYTARRSSSVHFDQLCLLLTALCIVTIRLIYYWTYIVCIRLFDLVVSNVESVVLCIIVWIVVHIIECIRLFDYSTIQLLDYLTIVECIRLFDLVVSKDRRLVCSANEVPSPAASCLRGINASLVRDDHQHHRHQHHRHQHHHQCLPSL